MVIIKSRIRENVAGKTQRIIYNTFVLIDIKETDVYTYMQVQMTGLTFTSSVVLLQGAGREPGWMRGGWMCAEQLNDLCICVVLVFMKWN